MVAPFIERLTLERFRSIRDEAIDFANPTIFVGQNGSGKSNLLDAFAFLSECMASPLQSVLESRGGIPAVGYRTPGRRFVETLGVRVDFRVSGAGEPFGHYSFKIREVSGHGFVVQREQCVLSPRKRVWFDRSTTSFRTNLAGLTPALDPQALALPIVGGLEPLAPLLKALAAIRVYAINPVRMREMQDAENGLLLKRDGSNVASVLRELARREPEAMDRIGELLGAITPGSTGVRPVQRGHKLALEFSQRWGESRSVRFDASAMSDGTLYCLGMLAAVMQEPAPPLIAIEEPETMIHPGALGAILDLIQIGAHRSQVVVTTHSPDLVDARWIGADILRVVHWENGATRVSPPGAGAVRALQQHLMSAGELFRANALDAAVPAGPAPPPLFDRQPA